MNPVIAEFSMNTPYGLEIAACWDGLIDGESRIGVAERFDRGSFVSNRAALVPEVGGQERSRLMGILVPVLERIEPAVPADASVLLATTTGEIDLLERSIAEDGPSAERSRPSRLLESVRELTGADGSGAVVSCACASSTAALARAAGRIRDGRDDAVLVVGCDAASEFVYAGFSTLMALSPEPARPFDEDRDGLTLGEAAVAALLLSPERASREDRTVLAEIAGTALTCDANHMTGPSRDGEGLARAITQALDEADVAPDEIAFISAHGTGTVYNDAMEMKAFRHVFDEPVPAHSIKGGTGHTMGAAGLLEVLVAGESRRQGVVPPTVGLGRPDELAAGWVSGQTVSVPPDNPALCVNSGFGGVNAAVVLGDSS